MNFSHKKELFLGLFVVLLLAAIPFTINLIQRPQEVRTRASGSTTLNFTPTSSTANPIKKNIGDTVTLDMMVDPGSNLVTFVRFQIKYDATLLEPTANPFSLNTTAFPTMIEGPVLGSGLIAASVSVGSDPTKVITKLTKVGSVTFKAKGATGATPTTVSFTTLSQALSSGATDQAAENVLSSTAPAIISIANSTGGPTATPSTSLTPQPTANSTIVTFSLLLHGIGAAGDNPNPGGNSLSNKNPLHPQRNLDVVIYDSNNQQVFTTKTNSLNYDKASGAFIAKVDVGPNFPTGSYNIKLKSDRYLRRLLPGIQTITNLQDNTIAQTALVAGDANGDNVLNVLDYNAYLDCGYGAINPLPMVDPTAPFNTSVCQVHTPVANVDVDDNGIVNSADYNLFLRELSVQNGD